MRLFALLLLLLAGATALLFSLLPEPHRPLHRLAQAQTLVDDGDLGSLLAAAERQAAYLARQDPRATVFFDADRYDNAWLLHSVDELIGELRRAPDQQRLADFLKENYIVYQAGGREGKGDRRMLVTGYYEPLLAGSLVRQPPYLHPIHRLPDTLVRLPPENGKTRVGRYDQDGKPAPFWSRAEIEEQGLLEGEELVYLRDAFDAFLLHVQGSGRIRLPDGEVRAVHYAGSNGLTYNSIGKLFVDEGILPLEQVNIPAMRAYFAAHPEEMARMLRHNPRYIFFAWGDDQGSRGSTGEVLTPGRSVAIDHDVLPGGGIAFLASRRPLFAEDGRVTGWTELRRLVFPQDSGSAIKGAGRVDLFWGSGDYAERAAGQMKEAGQLFFLVKKGAPANLPPEP
jgi:membrane-bound lytic murein transglycosylase A